MTNLASQRNRSRTASDARPTLDRRTALSYGAFVDEYLRPNKPVIVTDAIAHWGAVGRWTPEFFRTQYANMDVGLDGLTMEQFIDQVENSASAPRANLPYLRNKSINALFPELEPDVSPLPIYMQPNWFNNPLIPRRISRNRTDLFIGGVGSKFPYLHFDNYHGYAFLFQIYGSKTYVMYSPDQTSFLYPTVPADKFIANTSAVEDIEHPDLEKYPLFARAEQMRCVLRQGEMLFMPRGWWHTAQMDTPSISVSSNTANAFNWSDLMHDHWQSIKRRPAKALAGAVYLRVIWLLESLKDQLYRNRRLHKLPTP